MLCAVVVLSVVACNRTLAVAAIGDLARRGHQVVIHARVVETYRSVEIGCCLATASVLHPHEVFIAAAMWALRKAGYWRLDARNIV